MDTISPPTGNPTRVPRSSSLDALEEGTETSADHRCRYQPPGTRDYGPCRNPAEYDVSPLQERAHGERAMALWAAADALAVTDPDRWWRRVDRLLDCCRYPQAVAAPNGDLGLSLGRCRDRLCPTCSLIRSRGVAERVTAAVREMDSPRFVTLTIRSDGRPLKDMLQRLRDGWRRLRQTELWRRRVRGGVYVIETTYNLRTGDWHPHIHAVVDGTYIAQRQLSAQWLQATGDSPIVDIRAVRSRKAVARYVAKYVAKGVAIAEWPTEAIAEYADAMHGARLVHTFGSLHGVRLIDDGDTRITHDERTATPLSVLLRRLREGDARAARIIGRLRSLGGLWARLLPQRPNQPPLVAAERRAERATRVGRLLWAYSVRADGPPPGPTEPREPDRVARHDQLTLADEDWAALRPRHGPYLSG